MAPHNNSNMRQSNPQRRPQQPQQNRQHRPQPVQQQPRRAPQNGGGNRNSMQNQGARRPANRPAPANQSRPQQRPQPKQIPARPQPPVNDVPIQPFSLPKEKKKKGFMNLLNKVAKIEKLPKTVQDTIPLRGFMNNGIIETSPGVFTKSYKIKDINFNTSTEEEQSVIFRNYLTFVNSFDPNTRWELTIFNHEIDKRKTLQDIRIMPVNDGLNKYRQEMNEILLDSLKKGSNSIMQDKYLTVSIEDTNSAHAAVTLNKIDNAVNKGLKPITKTQTEPMSTIERIKLLYDIYNQDFDYRFSTGLYAEEDNFDLEVIKKAGLSVKDVIGPVSFDFSKGKRFMMGDTYAAAMALERVPSFLTSDFISDLSDIQCNLLISVTVKPIPTEDANRLAKSQLQNVTGDAAKMQKNNLEAGYVADLPYELDKAQKDAKELMDSLIKRDQKLFLMTMTVVVFARTIEQLEENIHTVTSVANRHMAPVKVLRDQQEFCFNTALPLCRDDMLNNMTRTTEEMGVFLPFNAEELIQKNALFYGNNQVTKSMILYDRMKNSNYNGLIFGGSGSGKSFIGKMEMINVLLKRPNAQVFVIDPQGEYSPMTKALGGQEILLQPKSPSRINPLDLDISQGKDDETDPVTMKSDFIISMFDIITTKRHILSPIETSILDECTRKIYRSYLESLAKRRITIDKSICPTLTDLYQELRFTAETKKEAGALADYLQQYTSGSFNTFSKRTNVKTDSKFIVYNTKHLGTGMKELGLHICTNDVWNRMIENSKKGIQTWFYIDEFHVLLESENTTIFLKRIWKMARKWLGVPTGIMQNTEDILRSAETRAIINNTFFVLMLNAPVMDRQNLAELYHLSNTQLEYITDADRGRGLLYNGKITVPFTFDFPTNTDLYRAMTTAHDA